MTTSPHSPSAAPLVGIVDDDEDLRRALRRLLIASEFRVQTYASAEAFLETHDRPDCLVLDVHLGGMTGIELYAELKARHCAPPAVFITAHDELARELEKTGARCLLKPFDQHLLMDAIAEVRCGRR